MANPFVLYERRGAAALITINRPEVRNCVNGDTAKGLFESYRAFAGDAPAERIKAGEPVLVDNVAL